MVILLKKDTEKLNNEQSADLPENIDDSFESELKNVRSTRRGKRKKKKNVLKYIILAIFVFVLIYLGMEILNSRPSDIEPGKVTGQMEIEAAGKYGFEVFGKNIITCNQNGIFAYNKSGEMQWKVEEALSNPNLYVKNEFLLVTDVARKNIMVLNKNGKTLSTVELGTECVSTSINKEGWITAILSVKGYKAQVAVYDNEGKLRYTWNSANNDILSAELCEDNRVLAVSQIDSISGAEANGVVSLFDITTEGKPFAGVNTSSNIISYLRWSGKNLICVGNNSVMKLNNSGKELWKYNYPGEIAMYNAKSDTVLVFAMNSNSTSSAKSYIFYTINDDGKELGTVELSGDLKNIEISGSDIAVVTSDKISILKKNASIKNEYTLSRDISKGFVLDGGKNYFVISGASAEIISLK